MTLINCGEERYKQCAYYSPSSLRHTPSPSVAVPGSCASKYKDQRHISACNLYITLQRNFRFCRSTEEAKMSDADNPRKRGRRSSPSPGPKNQDDSNHWAEDDENHAYHNPEPPPDSELAQNAEPVDRSYIISCLRKLLRKQFIFSQMRFPHLKMPPVGKLSPVSSTLISSIIF